MPRIPDLLRARVLIGLLITVTLWLPRARADELAGAKLVQNGEANIPACMACHGTRGEAQAATAFPHLAGQPKAYLEKQLHEFANGKRNSPQMAPIAGVMTTRQIQDVAEYYAGLPERKPITAPINPTAEYTLGEKLAMHGKWDKGMPACFSCHAAGGTGVPPHFPVIAGQPRTYTSAQLRAWQSNIRTNDPHGLMKFVAVKLTDTEISAVSLYLENPSLARKGN